MSSTSAPTASRARTVSASSGSSRLLVITAYSGEAAAKNAALSGASMLLLDGTLKRQVRDSVRCATCLNLGSDAYFADSFVEHMMF